VPPEVDPNDPPEEGEEEPEDDIQCIVYFWQVQYLFQQNMIICLTEQRLHV